MEITKTDLLWVYRGLKLLRDIIAESPELVNNEELDTFLIAWEVVNGKQLEKYLEDTND